MLYSSCLIYTPFLISPKGEKITPSPLGEGWEGGKKSV